MKDIFILGERKGEYIVTVTKDLHTGPALRSSYHQTIHIWKLVMTDIILHCTLSNMNQIETFIMLK